MPKIHELSGIRRKKIRMCLVLRTLYWISQEEAKCRYTTATYDMNQWCMRKSWIYNYISYIFIIPLFRQFNSLCNSFPKLHRKRDLWITFHPTTSPFIHNKAFLKILMYGLWMRAVLWNWDGFQGETKGGEREREGSLCYYYEESR